LLTDDAVILERGKAGWCARAIYGSLRLWPDAAGALFGSRAPSAPVAHYNGKRRIDVGALRPPAEPAPLAAVCILTGTRGRPSPTSLRRLTAGEALVALTAASFHLDIHDRERWRRVVEDLACVAEAVPVFALSYPRRLPSLAAAAREVLDRLTTALAGGR
jgi:hypothetical protein